LQGGVDGQHGWLLLQILNKALVAHGPRRRGRSTTSL
jgi:hypothetical protein